MGRGRKLSGFVGQGTFDVDMMVENQDVVLMLDRLVYMNLVKTKDVRKAFAKVLKPVKKVVENAAKSAIPNDPREAWRGIRIITLKTGEGAVVGLLNPSGPAKSFILYRKPRGGKSGIIRNRSKSDRTKQVEGYHGRDRAWILRIMNQGTIGRFTGSRNKSKAAAYRGVITAKKFFNAAEPAMKRAENALGVELGKIIEKASKE